MATAVFVPSGSVNNSSTIVLSAKELLMRQIDTASENLSNADTVAFKGFIQTSAETVYKNNDPSSPIPLVSYVQPGEVTRDLTQGSLKQTQNIYDFALNGRGYFIVQAGDQRMFTRDGRFRLNAQGILTTIDGQVVQGENGEIKLGDYETFSVQSDGTIMALKNGAQANLGKIKVVQFDDEQHDLTYSGFGRFVSDTEGKEPVNYTVMNGFVEGSNVNPVAESVRLMVVMRNYTEAQRMTESDDDLKSKVINLRVS